MNTYSKNFFKGLDATHYAADTIATIIAGLISPQSVADLGCGTGIWPAAFLKHNAGKVLGIDGPWVPKSLLEIPEDSFVVKDLEQPLGITQKFDLATSFEVAEHLSRESADQLVTSLVELADCVAFSAAVPFQGGVHHVNEQWQGYWIALFEKHGYVAYDVIRPRIWNDSAIPSYYKQNMLLFVRKGSETRYPRLLQASQGLPASFPVVHPDYVHPETVSLRRYLEKLPLIIKSFVRRKIAKF